MAVDDRLAKLWWAVPAATILMLMGLALVFGKPPEEAKVRTSYDASSDGFRAAYLLLEELGYPVVRSKRPTGDAVRLVLFPNASLDKANLLDVWVREGGLVILAVDKEDFAKGLGMNLKIQKRSDGEESASGGGIAHLAGGTVEVEWPGHSGEVWAKAGEEPVVTVYTHGQGAIWLVNRPEFLTNDQLRRADNAVLLCRLVENAFRGRSGKLAFDEYFHGMHERPGVTELLFEPPTLWVTLQGLVLLGLVLWRFAPRFGNLRPAGSVRRRSKEEFLDAMASLLERKGDYADAYRTAWEDLVQEMGRELGLAAGVPGERILQEAERRRPVRLDRFRRLLAAGVLPSRTNKLDFVKALHELENAYDEFFNGRHHR
ncbi:MAG TPA: DUF4350 domain-containing protein [Gemmataceae bacterium]|nr:DUF4350 domain-containing protein [Gemmataceae bacterium]